MASSGISMYEIQRTFLDNSSTPFAVTLQLNNEKSNFSLELLKFKFMRLNLVLGNIMELLGPLNAGNHSLEINTGIKWLQVLLVIGFGVELKHLHRKLRHILHLNDQVHSFIDLELFLVGFFELDYHSVLNLLELLWVEVFWQIEQAFFR